MKTVIGLACLVLAIFLTPAAWDVVVNSNLQSPGWLSKAAHVAPAALAWATGLFFLAGGSRSQV